MRLLLLGHEISRDKLTKPAVEMIAFRNIIAHGYDLIDDELVWSSITSEVPPLTHLCEQLLHDLQHP